MDRQLMLFKPEKSNICLNAYLACALTGLEKDERYLMFHLSDVVNMVCEKHKIDLYEPRKSTDPVHHKDVSDKYVFTTDRDRVLSSDLLIHLSHFPSTGSGEELEFANNSMLPMIIISRSEDKVSRMITGIPSFKIQLEYGEPEELRFKLDQCLTEIKPILIERKLSFSEYDTNIVGSRIKKLREQLGLSPDDIVKAIPTLTQQNIEQIENRTDKISNPSLVQLRQLATILKTTVADLVEPNIEAFVLGSLQNIIDPRRAAREGSSRDKNKILRRVLLRIIDSLEDE